MFPLLHIFGFPKCMKGSAVIIMIFYVKSCDQDGRCFSVLSYIHLSICHLTLHGAQCFALLKRKHSKIVFEFKLQRCNFNEIYKFTICHIIHMVCSYISISSWKNPAHWLDRIIWQRDGNMYFIGYKAVDPVINPWR